MDFHDILTFCEANIEVSNIVSIFVLYEGLSSWIQKDSDTHMHGVAVYMKEGPPLFFEKAENSDLYLALIQK